MHAMITYRVVRLVNIVNVPETTNEIKFESRFLFEEHTNRVAKAVLLSIR
jgi:hypothetical protein